MLASTWGHMIDRCYNPKSHQKYAGWGGRGIRVVDRWLHSFDAFFEDMGPRPQGCTLDRIDVNGDYTPENCRWASNATQARNRRNNVHLTIDGRTMCATDWSAESGTGVATILHRVKNGWDHKTAVFGRRFAKRYEAYTFNGETRTISGWAKKLGISKETVRRRLEKSGDIVPFSEPWKPRHVVHVWTFNGETRTLPEWARLLGCREGALRHRINRGWPVEKILGTPVASYSQRNI